jgi:hypothetical protein
VLTGTPVLEASILVAVSPLTALKNHLENLENSQSSNTRNSDLIDHNILGWTRTLVLQESI